ncbi:MAG: hypothetical protein ACI8SC_002316 [Colwellia sp.]|jgi:hypothetical protein
MVKENFNNVDAEHYSQKAYFFIKDNSYHVTISSYDKCDTSAVKIKLANTYQVKYTFRDLPLLINYSYYFTYI